MVLFQPPEGTTEAHAYHGNYRRGTTEHVCHSLTGYWKVPHIVEDLLTRWQ